MRASMPCPRAHSVITTRSALASAESITRTPGGYTLLTQRPARRSKAMPGWPGNCAVTGWPALVSRDAARSSVLTASAMASSRSGRKEICRSGVLALHSAEFFKTGAALARRVAPQLVPVEPAARHRRKLPLFENDADDQIQIAPVIEAGTVEELLVFGFERTLRAGKEVHPGGAAPHRC